MGAIIYSFNVNISPKMSRGVLWCDSVRLQNSMLTIFVRKDFVIKRGVICAGLCMFETIESVSVEPKQNPFCVRPELSFQGRDERRG